MNLINKIKTNRWKAFGIVVLSAVLTVFYIDNVFRVNNLLIEIQNLQKQLEEIKTSNQVINTKIIELESAERVTKIAEEKLGMTKPTKVPQKIKVSNDD